MPRSTIFFSFLAVLSLAQAAEAEDRLPTVPGTLLLHSRDAGRCLATEGGAAPLDAVLSRLATAHPGLRSIAFTWSDVRAAEGFLGTGREDAPGRDRVARWTEAAPGLTAHAFPDRTVFAEEAMCQPPSVTVPPRLDFPAARAWLLPVTGASSGAALGRPDALPAYLDALSAEVSETSHLAACLLLGGVLDRQPALAAALARPALEKLRDALAATPLLTGIDVATSGVMLQPNGVRLRGWDALFLIDVLDEPPTGRVCARLSEQMFGDVAPTVGPNPLRLVDGCPDGALAEGESLRTRVGFEERQTDLPENADDAIGRALSCLGGGSDLGAYVVTIEGYASRDGAQAANFALSVDRARAVETAFRQALRQSGACAGGACNALEIRSGGFGTTANFGPDADTNRIATITVTRDGRSDRTRVHSGLATAVASAYLDHDDRTCRPAGHRPLARAETLLTFLTSDYGRKMMAQLQVPDMVVLLHNQTGERGDAFARDLQAELGFLGPCGNSGGPHVGYLYERVGPPFASGEVVAGPERRDYFVLPPKITWIYPTPRDAEGPDLRAFARVAREFGLTSENGVDFDALADPDRIQYRRTWLNLVDVLRYEAPVPVSDVLTALRQAGAGTGWVNLTSGWD